MATYHCNLIDVIYFIVQEIIMVLKMSGSGVIMTYEWIIKKV